MPTRKEYKVNPLDLKPNKAVGVKLPLGGDPLFSLSYTTEEQAISNLKNLLLTRKGERPFQPEFGTDIYTLLFEQISTELSSTLEDSLRSDIEYWLPYIVIDEINIITNEDYNRVDISLKVKVTEQGANVVINILVSEQGNITIVCRIKDGR